LGRQDAGATFPIWEIEIQHKGHEETRRVFLVVSATLSFFVYQEPCLPLCSLCSLWWILNRSSAAAPLLLYFTTWHLESKVHRVFFSFVPAPDVRYRSRQLPFGPLGWFMRVLGFLVLCLVMGLPCFASPACKVEVVFQRPPKAAGHLVEILRKAEAGDRTAQFQAGLAFETGAGAEQDYPEAVKWYRKAANLGYPPAQNNLGGMYLRGLGVAQDDSEALRWYLRAAGEGYLAAENNVGFMNAAGRGAPANDQEAVHWYQRAADKGYAPAQSNLGFMYAQGRGVPVDPNQAVQWYRKAVAQNYAPAEYKLGLLYFEGTIVQQDFAEALRWLHKAATHGSASAENEIAYAYEHGKGVGQNYLEAEKWYRLAAEHGLPEARKNLEILAARDSNSSPRRISDASSQSVEDSVPAGVGFVGGRGPQ
jgi:TPR repeat protein